MRHYITACTFLLLILHHTLPAQTCEWATAFQNTSSISAFKLTHEEGRLLTMGMFYDTIDIDPGPGVTMLTTMQYAEHYLACLDTAGNFIWGNKVAAPVTLTMQPVLAPDHTAFGIVGYTMQWDADPGPGQAIMPSGSAIQIGVVKFDTLGQYQWAARANGETRLHDAHATPDGGIVIYGTFRNTVDFDPGPGTLHATTQNNLGEGFIWRLNHDGSLHSLRTLEGPGNAHPNTAHRHADASITVAGHFMGVCDLDPGPGQILTPDTAGIFLLHFDPTGQITSHFTLQLDSTAYFFNMGIDHSGGLIALGYIANLTDLDPGQDTLWAGADSTYEDIAVSFDRTGAYRWHWSIDQGNPLGHANLSIDPQGGFALSGTIWDSTDARPGPAQYWLPGTSNGDPYFARFDSLGQFRDARSYPSPGNGGDRGQQTVFSGNKMYWTGTYGNGPYQLDGFTLPNSGQWDAFVARFGEAPLQAPAPAAPLPALRAWPQPLGGTLHVEVPGQHKALPATLHDLQGRTILHTTLQPGTNHLDLSRLSAGMYILSTAQGHRMRVLKE